jgi:Domain of unknown function (DUF4169)
MGDIVNLRRARKRRDREASAKASVENRIRFGMTNRERRRIEAEGEKAERSLDSHRLEPPDDV